MVDRSFNGNGRFGSERSLWCSSSNDISLWNYEISSGKGAVDIGGSESELTIYFHSEYPWNFRDLMWLLNSGSWSSRGCNVDRMKGILSGCTWYGIFDALNWNYLSQPKVAKEVLRFQCTSQRCYEISSNCQKWGDIGNIWKKSIFIFFVDNFVLLRKIRFFCFDGKLIFSKRWHESWTLISKYTNSKRN